MTEKQKQQREAEITKIMNMTSEEREDWYMDYMASTGGEWDEMAEFAYFMSKDDDD